MQIASKLADLFERIYEIKGVNLRKLLFHGIPALAETGEATLLDFIPLVDPKTPADIVWSRDRIKKLKTKELVQFFDEWTSKGDVSRKKDMEPVLNRFWELTLIHKFRGCSTAPTRQSILVRHCEITRSSASISRV